jgi:hypothetical protein
VQDDTSELGAAASLLGADAQFEQALDTLLASLRRVMGVSEVTDPIVEGEFARARDRLQLFRADYLVLYSRAISNHIAAEHLASVIDGLSHPGTRRFRAVEAALNRDLAQETAALSNRMADTLLFEPPVPPVGGGQ